MSLPGFVQLNWGLLPLDTLLPLDRERWLLSLASLSPALGSNSCLLKCQSPPLGGSGSEWTMLRTSVLLPPGSSAKERALPLLPPSRPCVTSLSNLSPMHNGSITGLLVCGLSLRKKLHQGSGFCVVSLMLPTTVPGREGVQSLCVECDSKGCKG